MWHLQFVKVVKDISTRPFNPALKHIGFVSCDHQLGRFFSFKSSTHPHERYTPHVGQWEMERKYTPGRQGGITNMFVTLNIL